jgi:hypothetical protein
MNSSKLSTVMSQLFPFFMGGTLNLKEIVSNKAVIIAAIRALAVKMQTTNLIIDNGKLYAGTEDYDLYVFEKDEQLWKWFNINFLSICFSKGGKQPFHQHPIHLCLQIATAITKLYNRFQINTFLVEELDIIHSLKHKFEEWGHSGEFDSGFIILLEEIAIMQRLLTEYNEVVRYSPMIQGIEQNQYWIANTKSRIDNSITSCLEYVNTLV